MEISNECIYKILINYQLFAGDNVFSCVCLRACVWQCSSSTRTRGIRIVRTHTLGCFAFDFCRWFSVCKGPTWRLLNVICLLNSMSDKNNFDYQPVLFNCVVAMFVVQWVRKLLVADSRSNSCCSAVSGWVVVIAVHLITLPATRILLTNLKVNWVN